MRLILLILMLLLGVFHTPAQAQMDPAVAQRVLGATLTLRSADGRDNFLGSGFVYGQGDRVISNAHVVGKAPQVLVITAAGTRHLAQVVAVDTARDLAVLSLEAPSHGALTPAPQAAELGQRIFAAGAPLEASGTLTAGIVSATKRQIDAAQPLGYVQHSAPVNPGSSGGPLVDAAGAVLGVNTRIADGSRFFVGIAYAVSVAEVEAFLTAGALPDWPAPGVQLRPLTPRIRAALSYDGPGALIEQVHPNTPAARAGLKAGDIVQQVGDQPIETPGDMAFALAGQTRDLKVTYMRHGTQAQVTLTRIAPPKSLMSAQSQPVQTRRSYKLTDMGMVLDPDGTIRGVVSQGAGYLAGLTGGDAIAALNGVDVQDLPPNWIKTFSFDAPLLMRIRLPDGGTRHYVMDPWEDHSGIRLPSGANVLDQEVVNFD